MYQEKNGINFNENDFLSLYKGFNETVFNMENEEGDSKEYDLNAKYEINYACIWNKREAIDCEVSILQKNDKIALVAFKKEDHQKLNLGLLNCIYRLEDLTKIN